MLSDLWEIICRWISAVVQLGDAGYRHLRRATGTASGKAGTPVSRAYRYSPAATTCSRQIQLWGLGGGSGLCLQGQDSAAQLQRTQKPVSGAGQGPKQDGGRLRRGLVPCLREIPPDLRQTLTLDRGSEMAGFRELERAGLMHLLLQAALALAARHQQE